MLETSSSRRRGASARTGPAPGLGLRASLAPSSWPPGTHLLLCPAAPVAGEAWGRGGGGPSWHVPHAARNADGLVTGVSFGISN